MDKHKHWVNRSVISTWLCVVMSVWLNLSPPVVWAQEEQDGCATAILQAAFKDGLRSIEQTSVLTIQMRLRQLEYNPVWVDGVMGWRTRLALQAFCRSQHESLSADGIAPTLIRLLLLEAAEDEDGTAAPASQDGPAVYYRWTTPEKPEDAQADSGSSGSSGSSQAMTPAGSVATQTTQAACQGTASQPSQSASALTPTVASGTPVPTDASTQNQPATDQADGTAKTGGSAGEGTDSTPTSELSATEGEAQTSAFTSESSLTASKTTGSSEKDPASPSASEAKKTAAAPTSSDANTAAVESVTSRSRPTSDAGATAPESDAGSANSNIAASDTTPTPASETAKSQTTQAQASPVQSDRTGATQQPSQGCQVQQSKSDEQPKQGQALPDKLVERLKQIEGIAYPNQALFEQALRVLIQDELAVYEDYQDKILEQARQGPIKDFTTIQIAAADCGCSRDFSNLVYGFYPFWLVQTETDEDQGEAQGQPQQIDFSLFDRIGFYALSLSQEGEILNPLQWSNSENIAEFINQLHKYKVDVDLTVYATNWQDWSAKVMDKASSEVVKYATEKFSVTQADSLLQRLTASLQGSSARADGVTLVFDDYSKYAQKAGNIVAFIGKLAQKLKDLELDMKINILLGIEAKDLLLQQQTNLFSHLENILLKDITSSATVDYLLVYLPEPTSDTKKALRRKVEDEFKGAERQEVLRKLVAVISPDGHDKDARGPFSQFKDDLIYFQDNFSGLGLWPLPLESNGAMKDIRYNLIDLYGEDENKDYLRAFADTISPQICQFACPNRWLVRVAFDLLLGLVIVYALLAVWFCRLKEWYKKYFLYFLMLPLVILGLILLSLACDPFWGQKRDFVIGFFVLILFAFVMIKTVGKMLRPPLP
jgi:hypothetical protein